MTALCFYFQVHQPYRLRNYNFFDIGQSPFYEDEAANRGIMQKVANKCYLPMNALLLKLIHRHGERFKVTFSLSGMALDQFEEYAPEVLAGFQELADTGCVEFLAETYNHSLAFIFSPEEFRDQVALHVRRMESLFGVRPTSFRNTELIYNNDLGRAVEEMGFRAVLAEGADRVLDWRSPQFVYSPKGGKNTRLLLKNYALSDDIAFRFSNQEWAEFPLTAEKFSRWLRETGAGGDDKRTINLFMDYETFGEHQWETTGIFPFMEALPEKVLAMEGFSFMTVTESAMAHEPVGELDIPDFVSWADMERDLTAWLGNDMQQDAVHSLYRLEHDVKRCGDADLLKTWRRLQTSDHFYYMCTKFFSDGDVHRYFNPYNNPYDAYITFMNVLADLTVRVRARLRKTEEHEDRQERLAEVN